MKYLLKMLNERLKFPVFSSVRELKRTMTWSLEDVVSAGVFLLVFFLFRAPAMEDDESDRTNLSGNWVIKWFRWLWGL